MDVTCFRIFALITGPKLRPNIALCVGRGRGPSSDKELHFVLGVGCTQTLTRLYVLRARAAYDTRPKLKDVQLQTKNPRKSWGWGAFKLYNALSLGSTSFGQFGNVASDSQ